MQGRFEDVSFVEPTEQVIRLIGGAIERIAVVKKSRPLLLQLTWSLNHINLIRRNLFRCSKAVCHSIRRSPLLRVHFSVNLLKTNALCFALLSSSEPYGLQDFLASQIYDGRALPTFTLSNLYDYIHTALGSSLYASSNGKSKWAEIESAIERLPDPSSIIVRLIKTIGLLGIVGEGSVNLKASKALLRYALDDGTEAFQNEVDEPVALNPDTVGVESFESALAMLEQRSVAIYRRYNDAYALWEGSDIDIEARLREAAAQLDPESAITERPSRR